MSCCRIAFLPRRAIIGMSYATSISARIPILYLSTAPSVGVNAGKKQCPAYTVGIFIASRRKISINNKNKWKWTGLLNEFIFFIF